VVGNTVQLLLSTDSGATYSETIISSTSSGSDGVGSYTWTLPEEVNSQARVKIVSNDYPAVFDASTQILPLRAYKLPLLTEEGVGERLFPHYQLEVYRHGS
jgi:hypothetical protein